MTALLAWFAELPVSPYRIAHLVGAAVAVGITLALARRHDLDVRRVAVLAGVVWLGVWVGARLGNAVVNLDSYRDDPAQLLTLRFVRFSLVGALLGGLAVAVPVSRWLRLPTWRLGDLAVIGGGVGLACVRCGCFARGCCFGVTTEVPWGVTYPRGSQAWTAQLSRDPASVMLNEHVEVLPVHPTQLYEAAAALLAAGIAWYLVRRDAPAGVPILAAGAVFLVLRWFVWSVRSSGPLPLFEPRLTLLLLAIAVGAVLVVRRSRAMAV